MYVQTKPNKITCISLMLSIVWQSDTVVAALVTSKKFLYAGEVSAGMDESIRSSNPGHGKFISV